MFPTFLESATLLFVLLNPFLLSIYLAPVIQSLDSATFRSVLVRASLISGGVFWVVALVGDAIFTDVLQARFAAFQIFGGLIFVVVGFKFAVEGAGSIRLLRGEAAHLSGSIAMPFMVGPATISASILAGGRLAPVLSLAAIAAALTLTTAGLLVIKWLHDRVRSDHEALVERYFEVTGRIMAIVIGTLAVEMILRGVESWLATLE